MSEFNFDENQGGMGGGEFGFVGAAPVPQAITPVAQVPLQTNPYNMGYMAASPPLACMSDRLDCFG